MAVKYKQTLKQLFEEEKDLFTHFKLIHDNFLKNAKMYETDFNTIGSKVMLKFKQAEDNLCSKTEKGRYSNFSNQLSEKYWQEIKKYFPAIDRVKVDYGIKGVDIDELF